MNVINIQRLGSFGSTGVGSTSQWRGTRFIGPNGMGSPLYAFC